LESIKQELNANPPIGEGEPIQPKLWGCATALSISEYFED